MKVEWVGGMPGRVNVPNPSLGGPRFEDPTAHRHGGPCPVRRPLRIAADPSRRTLLTGVQRSWRLQQNLSQLLKIALEEGASPDDEPPPLKALLAKAGGARTYAALRSRLALSRRAHFVPESPRVLECECLVLA